MYKVEIYKEMRWLINFFVKIGLWHRNDKPTVTESTIKLLYSMYYLLFPLSLITGAIQSDNSEESIFLFATGLSNLTLVFRGYYMVWKKNDVVKMLYQVGIYSVDDYDDFKIVDNKLKTFMKFVTIFVVQVIIAAFCSIVAHVGYVGNEKKLFFNIGFPFDYKNNDIAFWMALAFNSTEEIVAVIVIFFSIVMWYIMIHFALKYEVLGNRLKKLGVKNRNGANKLSQRENDNLFSKDLLAGIEGYADINEIVNEFESFFSPSFSVQLSLSGVCICGSVYCLAYKNTSNLVEYTVYLIILLYNIFDIFMVMLFGNEITFHSERLSYCVFESNWVDRLESCKKMIIIFGKRLKQPRELIILKLYPLTLRTFTMILRAAYNMFNILKNMA